MQPPEEVDAGPVTLRPWRPDDLDAMARAVTESVEHLRPWMPWVAAEPMPRDDRAALIVEFRRQWDAGESFVYGIFAAVGGEPVGGTGLHPRIGPGGVEIGYWVHPAWVGQGIATAATRALTTAAFALPGIDRVEVHHDKATWPAAASPRSSASRWSPRCPDERPTSQRQPGRSDRADRVAHPRASHVGATTRWAGGFGTYRPTSERQTGRGRRVRCLQARRDKEQAAE